MASFLDVIFLLLFYVIMTTTFSRFGEVALTSGGAGAVAAQGAAEAQKPFFLRLGVEELSLNGEAVSLEALQNQLSSGKVLVQLAPSVTAQRLTDLLVVLNALPEIYVTVLE